MKTNKQKREYIDKYLINTKLVERIVYRFAATYKLPKDDLADLIQDVYVILLSKPIDFLHGLIDREEHAFYIIRIVKNQLLSKTSPYYRTYVAPQIKKTDILYAKEIEDVPEYL